MYKFIFFGLLIIGLALYFTGALTFNSSGSNMGLSIDKDKAKKLEETIAEHLEE